MGVPRPPILQDHASPSNSGTAKRSRSSHDASTAIATGISISADAVLEIHILRPAPASMKPITNCRGRCPPTSLTTDRATRWCAPELSIPRESKNPPNNKIISGEPTAPATCSTVKTPAMGNTDNGRSDVTGIGIGSKIHQTMQSQATTAVTIMGLLWSTVINIAARQAAVITPGQTVCRGSK